MPYSAIITFDCISFCLRLNVFYIRKKFLIALPIVRIIHRCRNVFYLLPKLHPRICASVPTDKRDKSFSKSINSNPYPSVVFLNPNYAIHCSAFTINHGRTNARQWLRQAYSPPPGCDAFFPNASHWAELSRPFRALSAISSQHSAISRANKSTSQQFNNSPPLRGLRGLKARIISAPSRKGGVYRHPDLVRRAESLN